MDNITIYDSEYITVEYHPEAALIYHTIHKPIELDEGQYLKDAVIVGAQALKKYGLCKWLSDDRKNGPLPDELVEWANREWNIPTIEAGWKYWANVVPVDVHAANTLTPIINHLYRLGLTMMVFTTVEDAKSWLSAVG